ncbi:HAMP domain-containing protein [Robertmurraya yapensis]|uniref:histidine kinase n=1 Tax=Bacillus yapensis TaxID=2492960 RepID=A0A3S0KMW3_9BACI|nr:ATP-binding protein [Bacillus yapensis]RTR30388.1 HAMP domain-containing protein [Bacillus yapensis]TKS95207.1 cell wall metabolism sensor histidine kinase WalK [Bacillus yapensis]
MMFWRSVVGKLWFTILFLVSFVLFILTVMLLEYFENDRINEAENNLEKTATRISHFLEDQEESIGLQIAWELLDDATEAMIIYDENEYFASPTMEESFDLPVDYFLKDSELNRVFTEETSTMKIASFPVENYDEDSRFLIIGAPIHLEDNKHGAVFIMQSLQVLKQTSEDTKKFILLAAGVAFVLTTIFAFFLATRINAPLRKMKEAATEIARGKFDTKVPILTHDEIGELATAFNQMGRQLKFNLNALSQEKEQLSSILSSMVDGVITFNRDGTILITNPPAERFLQDWYFEQDGRAKSTEEVPTKVMELFQLAVNTEQEQVGEIHVQGRFWVIIVSPLYNNKFIRGAVAVVRDMTEERQLDKLRQDFIANVSHELRTPISMLQGYSEAIVDGIAATEDEKIEMARVIYDESLRMGRLVNELLDLARMEAGHIQLTISEIEVKPYLERIIRKFQGLAKEKEIYLQGNFERLEPYFAFDGDRIEQVLTNLIDNAMRYTEDHGTINVTANTDEKGLHIEVFNTGIGIPEEDLPFVFERFYKSDKARTRGSSGTGLGLAIAKNIIEGHKGYITVQSKAGHGTTFSFFIPRNIQ